MELKAIYPTARLGSYYDQHQDLIVMEKNGWCLRCSKPRSAQFKPICGKTDDSENLLLFIGVQVNSRLNILLGIVEKTRLTSIIDYPFPIDEYTRILHYTYIRNIRNRVRCRIFRRICRLDNGPDNATHRIVRAAWGIEFIVLLQLPHERERAEEIDKILKKLNSILNTRGRQRDQLALTENEKSILEQVTHTEVYSNNPGLTGMKTIAEIYQNIHLLQKKNRNCHRPITLTVEPVDPIHLPNNNNDTIKERIENHLLSLLKPINCIKGSLSRSASLSEYLKEQRDAVDRKWSELEKQYQTEIERWKALIIQSRNKEIQAPAIENMLHDERSRALKKLMDQLNDDFHHLQVKEEFIKDLQQKSFQYHNVSKEAVCSLEDVRKVVKQLVQSGQYDRFLCSTDSLNTEQAEFHKARDQLVEEHARKSNLCLVYVDFTSCTFQLPDIIVLTAENIDNIPPAFGDDCVNILLLGESGVGKSTFINAFVNYLVFDSLKEVELSKQPVVLMPVSFLITTGEKFR